MTPEQRRRAMEVMAEAIALEQYGVSVRSLTRQYRQMVRENVRAALTSLLAAGFKITPPETDYDT